MSNAVCQSSVFRRQLQRALASGRLPGSLLYQVTVVCFGSTVSGPWAEASGRLPPKGGTQAGKSVCERPDDIKTK